MSNEITYGVAVLAVIAIAMAAYSLATPTDTSDFVLKSDQKEFVDTVMVLVSSMQEPCYQDPECVKFFSRKFVTDSQVNAVINDIVAVQEQHQKEIIINRDNFIDNHPFNFEPEEFDVVGEVDAFEIVLPIYLEKENWLCAEPVVFTGDATAFSGQVHATVTEPDGNLRFLNAIVYDSGEYRFSFGTVFGCQLGEYSVYVEQGHRRSQTVSFNIIE